MSDNNKIKRPTFSSLYFNDSLARVSYMLSWLSSIPL